MSAAILEGDTPNSVYEQKFGAKNRFQKMYDLHARYILVRDQTEEHRQKWENYMKAYRRQPYQRKDGGIDANFGQFRFKIDSAVDAFKSVIMEREFWAKLVPKNAPDAATKADWTKKMSQCWHEEFIRPWLEGIIQTHWDVFNMQMFMAGVAHFQNKGDIYPESIGTEMLYPDLGSSVIPSEWGIAFILKRMSLSELYEKTKETDTGWNTEAIHALLDEKGGEVRDSLTSMERLRLSTDKQLDTNQSVLVVIAYVREYSKSKKDAKVTKYVFPESGILAAKTLNKDVKEERYLCKVENYCSCISEVIAIRTFHSFRDYWSGEGLSSNIFVACMQYDQTMNRAIRSSLRKATMYFNSNNPDEQDKLRKMPDAEVVVLDPDTKIAQVTVSTELADLSTTTKQLMFDTEKGTGESLSMGSQNVRNRAITAEEQRSNVMREAEQKTTQLDIFILQDTYLIREMVKRSLKVTGSEEEGESLERFKTKMAEYGIPEEAYEYDDMLVESSYSIIAGSISSRLQIIDKLIGYTRIKPEHSGVENAVRDGIATIVGYDTIDHYYPYSPKPDESQVERAGTENEILDDPDLNPINVQVLATHNHPAHMEMHLMDSENDIELAKLAVEQFKQVPFPARAVTLEKAHVRLRAVDNKLSHCEAHKQMLMLDEGMQDYVKAVEKRMGKIRTVQNDVEALHKNNIQAFVSDNQQNAYLTQEQQYKIADLQMKLDHEKAMNEVALGKAVEQATLRQTTAEQRVAQNEQSFAQDMVHDRVKTQAELEAMIQKESTALAAQQQKAINDNAQAKNKKGSS
jgi:hypothetical protein